MSSMKIILTSVQVSETRRLIAYGSGKLDRNNKANKGSPIPIPKMPHKSGIIKA